jgi:predicted phosphodiesterase
MKIQILSDTHGNAYTIEDQADLVVHAGDFGNHGLMHLYQFVNLCELHNKPYVIVIGNHDFYGHNYMQVYAELDRKGINYLKDGREFKFQNKTFVGGTLFTNFRSNKEEPWVVDNHKQMASDFIYDFSVIRMSYTLENDVLIPTYVTPEFYVTEFNKQYNWINKYRDREDVIVITHFPMSIECLDPYWASHPEAQHLNPYFINDLDVKGFKTIISGHTHTAFDRVVDGCRLIINPLGHAKEQDKNGFRPNLIIEI